MPPPEEYKLTLRAKSRLSTYKKSLEKMNTAKAKFDAAREKTASKRAEALFPAVGPLVRRGKLDAYKESREKTNKAKAKSHDLKGHALL